MKHDYWYWVEFCLTLSFVDWRLMNSLLVFSISFRQFSGLTNWFQGWVGDLNLFNKESWSTWWWPKSCARSGFLSRIFPILRSKESRAFQCSFGIEKWWLYWREARFWGSLPFLERSEMTQVKYHWWRWWFFWSFKFHLKMSAWQE